MSSFDIAFDDEALRLAKESGCECLFIGFETLYPKDYEKTSVKNTISTQDYFRAIKKIKSFGIKIIGAFILGFDNYSHRDYLRLLIFLIRANFWYSSLTMLTPFPGSKLFERFKEEGRILTFDWRKYDLLFHVVFKPNKISTLSLKLWFIFIRSFLILLSPWVFKVVAQSLLMLYLSIGMGYYITKMILSC